jgi:hypothetical protein
MPTVEATTKQQLLKTEKTLCVLHFSMVSWLEFLATDPEARVRFPALPDFFE